MTLSLPSYTGSALKRELNFCSGAQQGRKAPRQPLDKFVPICAAKKRLSLSGLVSVIIIYFCSVFTKYTRIITFLVFGIFFWFDHHFGG